MNPEKETTMTPEQVHQQRMREAAREKAEREKEFANEIVAFIPARPGDTALVAWWWLETDADVLHVEIEEQPVVGWGVERSTSAETYEEHACMVARPVLVEDLGSDQAWAIVMPDGSVRAPGWGSYSSREEWTAHLHKLKVDYEIRKRNERRAEAAVTEAEVAAAAMVEAEAEAEAE